MPRDGSGHSHNAEEAGDNLTHGTPAGNEQPTSSGVDRSSKAAPPPDHETGEGLKNEDGSVASSGQGSIGVTGGSGKGPMKSTVDEQAEKLSK
ncbi:hypothetical protein M409DRAFT_22462 [Zasmidium cellare ATCC 36951]|uniref:Uncharacterized protein n=1 Tax=Zasmidium cellare ATCC 36951 TaxID=1080233 RepID=A0A6A6CK90_ZASCE|nr:uncharacterized protein M409DRAFT_22462 [Zasmidium cellare ATCC 36951]KAF2167023.1 hypothetical protein M409DRAFT_22462 [Zasmidium cellare ATCC 36951]